MLKSHIERHISEGGVISLRLEEDEEVKELSQYLNERTCKIEVLEIIESNLTPSAIYSLSQVQNTSIECIKLYDCDLDDSSISVIIVMINQLNLLELNIGGNKFTYEGLTNLIGGIEKNIRINICGIELEPEREQQLNSYAYKKRISLVTDRIAEEEAGERILREQNREFFSFMYSSHIATFPSPIEDGKLRIREILAEIRQHQTGDVTISILEDLLREERERKLVYKKTEFST